MMDASRGLASYFSEELGPSRRQYQAIALLALELLGEQRPRTRLDATVTIARLRGAADRLEEQAGVRR